MLRRVCDVCLNNPPTFKMKYKAKQLSKVDWTSVKWEKIELCEWCLRKIIEAKESEENG